MFIAALYIIVFFLIFFKPKKGLLALFVLDLLDGSVHVTGALVWSDLGLALLAMKCTREFGRFFKDKDNPFKFCVSIILLSYILTAVHSNYLHLPTLVLYYFRLIIYSVLFWNWLKDISFYKLLYRSLVIVSFLIAIVAIVEIAIGYSPWLFMLKSMNIDNGNVILEFKRFGIQRIQTFFTYCTGCGYACCSLMIFFIINSLVIKSDKRQRLLIGLLMLCIFLTSSRGVIVPSIVCFILYYWKQLKRSNYLLLSLFFLVFLACFKGDYIDNLVSSVVDSDNNKLGSSIEMRTEQWYYVLMYAMRSLWFGNGYSYTFDIATKEVWQLFGAESVWFFTLIDFGVLGIFAYLCQFIWPYLKIRKDRHSSYFLIACITLISINSITSVPGVNNEFTMLMLIIYYRILQYYQFNIRNLSYAKV